MWYKQDKAGVSRWIRLYFPKDINNCKTNSYTFISVFTLRKYYKEMDGDQVIHHFELYEYENETFTLILNYFKLIKNFEIIKCPCNRCVHNFSIKREIQEGLQPFRGSYPIFTPLAFELTPMSSDTTYTSWNINLICTPSSAETEEGDSKSSLNFTTLTSIDFQPKDCYALKPCLLKLHKLHSHHHYDKVIRTPWATLYDAAILRELALVGTFDFQKVFPIGDLTIEYPLLRQLCIRIRLQKSLVSAIANLGHLRHDTLSSLIISYDTNNNTVAREICKLCMQFPRSSIHYWYEAAVMKLNSSFTKTIINYSPTLPFGVVGYHFPEDYCTTIRITKSKFKIGYREGKAVFGRLRKCFSDHELVVLYNQQRFYC